MPEKAESPSLERRFRIATGKARILPSFLVIGAQRGGTTSLFAYLRAHPEVADPAGGEPRLGNTTKELHFFDSWYEEGLGWYRSFFPLAPARQLARLRGSTLVAGESTPYYLYHPLVPGRVATAIPEVKLIALLRDPIERAYSHYQLMRRIEREPLSFEEAIAAEDERLAKIGESFERAHETDAGREGLFHHRHHSYLDRGLYAEQLERWYAHFPREQILVIRTEDMQADSAEIYGQVLDFLGLSPWSPGNFVRRNRAKYAPIDPELRRSLEERFVEPNGRLAELLGRDFGWASPSEAEQPAPNSRA